MDRSSSNEPLYTEIGYVLANLWLGFSEIFYMYVHVENCLKSKIVNNLNNLKTGSNLKKAVFRFVISAYKLCRYQQKNIETKFPPEMCTQLYVYVASVTGQCCVSYAEKPIKTKVYFNA